MRGSWHGDELYALKVTKPSGETLRISREDLAPDDPVREYVWKYAERLGRDLNAKGERAAAKTPVKPPRSTPKSSPGSEPFMSGRDRVRGSWYGDELHALKVTEPSGETLRISREDLAPDDPRLECVWKYAEGLRRDLNAEGERAAAKTPIKPPRSTRPRSTPKSSSGSEQPFKRRVCKLCFGYLQAVGDRRQGGKVGSVDQPWRGFHVQCYPLYLERNLERGRSSAAARPRPRPQDDDGKWPNGEVRIAEPKIRM